MPSARVLLLHCPPTEVEATYLGEASDAVKAKATEFASEQTDRATKVAGAVIGCCERGSPASGIDDGRRKIRSRRYLGKGCPRGRCGWQGSFPAIDSEIFVGIAEFYTSNPAKSIKWLAVDMALNRFRFYRIAEEQLCRDGVESAMERQFLALAVGGIVALIIGLAVAVYHPRQEGILLRPGLHEFSTGQHAPERPAVAQEPPARWTWRIRGGALQGSQPQGYETSASAYCRAARRGTNTFPSHFSRGSCEVAEC